MKDMLAFVKDRRREGDFRCFVDRVGEKAAYLASIEIISWLKRQRKLHHERPLALRPGSTWSESLPSLLELDPSFGSVLEISSNQLRFRDAVDAAERESLRELADTEYTPTVRTAR